MIGRRRRPAASAGGVLRPPWWPALLASDVFMRKRTVVITCAARRAVVDPVRSYHRHRILYFIWLAGWAGGGGGVRGSRAGAGRWPLPGIPSRQPPPPGRSRVTIARMGGGQRPNPTPRYAQSYAEHFEWRLGQGDTWHDGTPQD